MSIRILRPARTLASSNSWAMRIALAGLLTLAILPQQPALAQLDTPAALEARAALRQVRQTYRSQPTWAKLSADLGLMDLEHELRVGDHAEVEVLESAAKNIRAGKLAPLRERPFERLATALETRAGELVRIPASDWPQRCREQPMVIDPATAEEVQAAKKHLTTSLDNLEKRSTLKNPADPWRKFLFWTETRALATAPPPDAEMLDRLETRWDNAPDVWDSFELVEASFAVRSLIHLLRAQQLNETPDERAAAWNRLAQLLETRGSDAGDRAAIAKAVRERERLGEASALTASIHRELALPNLVIRARPAWVQSQMSPKISEPVRISGVYGGASTTGRGRMTGATRFEMLPSSAVGQFRLHLDATSTSSSTAYSQGATVRSSATTRIAGVKSFTLDERGLSPQPARANATTRIVYNSIDGGGGGIRQRAATSETYSMRAQAERDSSADAQRSTTGRMDTEGKKLADNFNRWYQPRFREGIMFADQPCPELRVRTSDKSLRWEMRLEEVESFAAPAPPPDFEADADVVISTASSGIDQLCRSAFGGRNLTRDQLSKRVAEILGAPTQPSSAAGQNYRVAFAPRACESRLADGALHTTFHITSFEVGGVKYPEMAIEALYKVTTRDGDLVLVRDGPLQVKMVAPGGGRQQTLRTVVQRTLGKVLAEELTWSPVETPQPTGKPATKGAVAANTKAASASTAEPRFRVERAQAGDGWLQIALSRK